MGGNASGRVLRIAMLAYEASTRVDGTDGRGRRNLLAATEGVRQLRPWRKGARTHLS